MFLNFYYSHRSRKLGDQPGHATRQKHSDFTRLLNKRLPLSDGYKMINFKLYYN